MSSRVFVFSVLIDEDEILDESEVEIVTDTISQAIPSKSELLDIKYTQDNTFEVNIDLNNTKKDTIDQIIKNIEDKVNKKKIKINEKLIKLKFLSIRDGTSSIHEVRFRLVDKDGKPLSDITRKEEDKIEKELEALVSYISDTGVFNPVIYGHKIEGNKLIFYLSTTEKIYKDEKETLEGIILDSFNDEALSGMGGRSIRIVVIKETKKLSNPRKNQNQRLQRK